MQLVFQQKIQQTPTVFSFLFKPTATLHFTAGQFIRITVAHDNLDQRGTSRTFTIASSPTESFVMITTRMSKDGSSFKKALLALSPPSIIEAGEPHGLFILSPEATPCIFITGGVGITPVRSIVKFATDNKISRPLTLLYSNSTPEEIVYYDFLNELITHNSNLDIVYTITQPEKSSRLWSGRVGRINKELVTEKAKQNTMFYISGPTTLVSDFYNLLKEMGVEDDRVKRENFPGY